MWLQRFTDKSRLAACILTLLVIAGCGSVGGLRDTGASAQRAGSEKPGEGDAAGPAIPAQAMTLFEQATAVIPFVRNLIEFLLPQAQRLFNKNVLTRI